MKTPESVMEEERSARGFKIRIAHEEWLTEGLKNAEQTFRLSREGKIPESIKGWMLVTSCMRVLRSIYGSDLDTAIAIRERVIDAERRSLMEGQQSHD